MIIASYILWKSMIFVSHTLFYIQMTGGNISDRSKRFEKGI